MAKVCDILPLRAQLLELLIEYHKLSDIQLRAQAIVLAKEGYSYSIIAKKLNRSKWWVTNWVGRNRDDELLVAKPRNGRPTVLCNVAKKLIRNIKYKSGHGVRRLEKQLKTRGETGSRGNHSKIHVKRAEVAEL